jgi:UTP-glucose-1-phosphate uridylyltransferase
MARVVPIVKVVHVEIVTVIVEATVEEIVVETVAQGIKNK